VNVNGDVNLGVEERKGKLELDRLSADPSAGYCRSGSHASPCANGWKLLVATRAPGTGMRHFSCSRSWLLADYWPRYVTVSNLTRRGCHVEVHGLGSKKPK
jgi:hypothetical protein